MSQCDSSFILFMDYFGASSPVFSFFFSSSLMRVSIISSSFLSCFNCYSMFSCIFFRVSYSFSFSLSDVFSLHIPCIDKLINCYNSQFLCNQQMSKIANRSDANSYGLGQIYISAPTYTPQYGQIMIASQQSKGGLMMITESKGKKIISISGGNKKVFIFEEENQSQNVVTALHPENEDYLVYKGEEILPIHEIVMALEGNKINEIKSGKEHNIILTEQGSLYAYGKGNFGSLGLGGTIFSPAPRPISKLSNKKILSVACGMFHTLALSDIGDVYSWGRGFEGQLGLLESIESMSVPRHVPHFFKYNNSKEVKMLQKTPIISIACGSYHSIAIDNNNQIYCWGQARYGQTGNGKKTKETVPVKIAIEVDVFYCAIKGVSRKVVQADGGFGHTLCLTSQGEIFSWGLNIKGQLGLNDLPEHIKSTEGHLNYLKASYEPIHVSQSRQKIPLPRFKEIACGFTSSFAIDMEGNAWGWGGGNIGFKDKYIERGPVMITETTENKKFSKIFANDNAVLLFCSLTPLYFKPALVPSSGKTEITFFGNGLTHTGLQTVRFTLEEDKVEAQLQYDEKTSTYYCKTPIFQKINKKYTYPLQCKVQISLDKKQYFAYQKPLLVYSSKLQIQSIEPNCGSVLGGSSIKLYMPIPSLVLEYIDNITVGFKNTNNVQKKENQNKIENNQDWICTEGIYENQTISCKIPNIPHFNHENPFYMLDISINGQDFTELPHTFRYYFISQTKITPNQSEDNAELECTIQGNGLFDTPNKQLKISLNFDHKDEKLNCERSIDLKWNKVLKKFQFKMPKLSWIIGDHNITPQLLEDARKKPCILELILGKNESVEIGKYNFVLPPPPPEPQEDKKDAKKDNKKGAKK